MTERAIPNWRTYTSPAQWYSIRYPAEWRVEEHEECVRWTIPSSSASLTLECLWIADTGDMDLGTVVDVSRWFHRPRRVRRTKSLDVAYRSVSLEGESVVPISGPWWKRTFLPQRVQKWRLWGVQHGPVCVVARFLQSEKYDPELPAVAAMVLKTLQLSESPADPPSVFADRVVQLARDRFPLLECKPVDEFRLQLGESNINLFNFYRSYVNSPNRFEEILLPALTTVVQVQEWGVNQTEPPLEGVRERIMPMLYPEDVWRKSFESFVGVPWVAGLAILYVVDESHAYWYLREDLLERWGLSVDELHELALANLDDYFEKHEVDMLEAGAEDGPRVLVPERPDAYNSARLLSPTFHRDLRDRLGREFAVGIPGRDFCVAVDLSSADVVDGVRNNVEQDFGRMDHPLTDRLLLVSADGVSEFCSNKD